MILYGYGCPECGGHNPTAKGCRFTNGWLQVKCRICGFVENIPPTPDITPEGRRVKP